MNKYINNIYIYTNNMYMYVFCITMFQITDFPATEPGAGAHERHPRGSPTAQQESGGGAPKPGFSATVLA